MVHQRFIRFFLLGTSFLYLMLFFQGGDVWADDIHPAVQMINSFVRDVFAQSERPLSTKAFADLLEKECVASQEDQHVFYRTNDLINYIAFLDSRVRFFQKNNDLLKSFLRDVGGEAEDADTQFSQLLRQEQSVFRAPLFDKFFGSDRMLRIQDVYDYLKSCEAILVERVNRLRVINDGFRSLKMDLVLAKRKNLVQTRYQEQFHVMEARLGKKDRRIASQNQDIQGLKTRFDQVQLALGMFRERLQTMSQKVDGLVNDVASGSLDLYQKQMELADKKQKISMLDSELQETNERLKLVQRIIQEKDDHIQKLEEEVIQIQSQMKTGMADGQSVESLRKEFEGIVENLKIEIGESQAKIARLEEKFQDAALANAQLQADLTKKGVMLSLLKHKVDQKDGMIADLEKGFRLRTEKLFEMEGVVQIYQLKLQDYQKKLEEKESELQQFQQRETTAVLGMPEHIFLSADTIYQFSDEAVQRLYYQKED